MCLENPYNLWQTDDGIRNAHHRENSHWGADCYTRPRTDDLLPFRPLDFRHRLSIWHGMTWYDTVEPEGVFFLALQPQSSCPNPGQLQPQWKQPSRQGSPGDAQGPGFIDLWASVDSSQYLWVSKGGPSQLIVARIPWPSSTESTEYNRILRKICESRVDIDEQKMNKWWTDIIRYPALIMYVL